MQCEHNHLYIDRRRATLKNTDMVFEKTVCLDCLDVLDESYHNVPVVIKKNEDERD